MMGRVRVEKYIVGHLHDVLTRRCYCLRAREHVSAVSSDLLAVSRALGDEETVSRARNERLLDHELLVRWLSQILLALAGICSRSSADQIRADISES